MRSGDDDDLTEVWWEASAKYRKDPHWLKAEARLKLTNPDVMLISPGDGHPLGFLTRAAEAFLQRVGFRPLVIDSGIEIAEHRARASNAPRVLALPVSVGSVAEVFDLWRNVPGCILKLLVPSDCADNYFVRIIESDADAPRMIRCGRVLEGARKDVGKRILQLLAESLGKEEAVERAAALTAEVKGFPSLQGKEAKLPNSDPDLPPEDPVAKPEGSRETALTKLRGWVQSSPRWLTFGVIASLVTAVVQMAWVAIEPLMLVVGVGALVAAVTAYYDPRRRHWRLARWLLGGMALKNFLPSIELILSDAGTELRWLAWISASSWHWTLDVVIGLIILALLVLDARERDLAWTTEPSRG